MTAVPEDRLVTIYGGSGFVGRHTVRALARAGWRIRVGVRRPELAHHLQPLGRVGQIHAVQANLRHPESVARAAEGADALINLAAVLYESGRQRFQTIHVEGPATIARIAAENGARFVHISGIGADPQSRAAFGRSKGEGEAAVFAALPDAIVVRPSVVFGPEDHFFNRFAGMARLSPALPLIGGGTTRFQPVFVGDVAATLHAAVEGRARPGAIYELGGPEVKTFKELMEIMLREIGRRRLLLPIPFPIARLQAFFLELLPRPLLTRDQVTMLESDNVVSEAAEREGRTLQGLGISPTAMETVLPTYLSRFRRAGQFTRPAD